jgi:hypothetical protein
LGCRETGRATGRRVGASSACPNWPSSQASIRRRANGSGTKNIFDAGDAIYLVILADLRRGGAEIKLLEDAAGALRELAAHSTGEELLWITDQVQVVSDPGLLAENADRYGPALIYATSRAHRALSEFEADPASSECHGIPSIRAVV